MREGHKSQLERTEEADKGKNFPADDKSKTISPELIFTRRTVIVSLL
jgi:hypothetical protein